MRAVRGLALAALLCGGPAAADEFFDCASEANAKAIDPTAPFTCAVLEQHQVAMANGMAPVRILADATSNPDELAPWRALILESLTKHLAVWTQHAALKLLPLTIVLFDPNDPASPIGGNLGLHSVLAGQCLFRVNTRALASQPPGEIEDFFRRVVAHELVHCVQASNWPGPASAAGNTWWVEGGADMLAGVLYPPSTNDLARQAQFNSESAAVPLTRMAYEASTFFYWLWGKDPALVFKLMAAMPTEPGEAAQRSALLAFMEGPDAQAAVGERGLDRFAQDYVDGDVRNPLGAVVVHPDLGPPIIFDETRSVTFNAQPFTVQRAYLGFIGDFALPTFDALGTVWARPADGDWDELPLFVDQEGCEQPRMYKIARMPTADSDHGFRLDASQTESCEICRPSQARDPCMVGRWSVDMQAMTDDLRQRIKALSGLSDISGEIVFDLRDSGSFAIGFDHVFIGGVVGDDKSGAAAWWLEIGGEDSGTWSAENGVMTLCIHEPGSTMVNTIALDETQRYVTDHSGYAQSGVYSYACGATTLLDYSGPIVMPEGYQPRWTLNKVK